MDRSIARAAVNFNGSPAVPWLEILCAFSVPGNHCAEQEMVAAIFKILKKLLNKVNCLP